MGNHNEFAAQVIRHLPELTDDERQEWIKNPTGLKEVLETALAVELVVMRALREGAKEAPFLRLLPGAEVLSLGACGGNRNLANASDVFDGNIDPDFTNWGLNVPGIATPAMFAQVHEHAKDGTFRDLFTSLSDDLDRVAMKSQHQIVRFCQEHYTWLGQDGHPILFLFKERGEFFVACVYVRSGGLDVRVDRFENDDVLNTRDRRRLVSLQLEAETL